MELPDIHKYLLRLLVGRSLLTMQDAKYYVAARAGTDNIDIRQMVDLLNEKMAPLQNVIKIVKDEKNNNEECLVFIFKNARTRTKNVFSPMQIHYFQAVFEEITSTAEGEIPESIALNLVKNLVVNGKRMTKEEAKNVLDTWCFMRYFHKDDDDYYSLGVRTYHEFEKELADLEEYYEKLEMRDLQ